MNTTGWYVPGILHLVCSSSSLGLLGMYVVFTFNYYHHHHHHHNCYTRYFCKNTQRQHPVRSVDVDLSP